MLVWLGRLTYTNTIHGSSKLNIFPVLEYKYYNVIGIKTRMENGVLVGRMMLFNINLCFELIISVRIYQNEMRQREREKQEARDGGRKHRESGLMDGMDQWENSLTVHFVFIPILFSFSSVSWVVFKAHITKPCSSSHLWCYLCKCVIKLSSMERFESTW